MPDVRVCFLPVLFLLLLCGFGTLDAAAGTDWDRFKEQFLTPDGRVVDRHQKQISHSEGQGYALLVAASEDDRSTFELVWQWTRDNLQVRKGDRLCAWSWGEHSPGQWKVLDYNNATDGDTLVAWALFLAAAKWDNDAYRQAALEIIQDLRRHLIWEQGGKLYVLPGYYGFSVSEGLVINPSYLLLPAYKAFAQATGDAFWNRLHRDCLAFLGGCAFGRLGLPADWVVGKDSRIAIYTPRSELFGFEAVRVILTLSWDGSLSVMPKLNETLQLFAHWGHIPQSVNLVEDCVSLQEASAGTYAIFAHAARTLGATDAAQGFEARAREKLATDKDDYYAQVLFLLAHSDLNR